jgi:hypothetical protein
MPSPMVQIALLGSLQEDNDHPCKPEQASEIGNRSALLLQQMLSDLVRHTRTGVLQHPCSVGCCKLPAVQFCL